MLYLQKGQQNELILNINNNSRQTFATYTLVFTHVLSQETKSYVIDTSDQAEFGENERYCEIILDLNVSGQDLNYEGQYDLKIYGNGSTLVFTGLAMLEGTTEQGNTFTEYVSNDEDNDNYIYIQE
jgi:hypothetical protein